MKSLTHLASAFLNKTRDTKDAISAGPKQDFMLHATNNLTDTNPPTIKVYQTTKITKLALLFLPLLIFKNRFTILESKSDNIFFLAGNRTTFIKFVR